FWAGGWILAAVIGTFVATSGPTGWRWALALGMVPAVYSIVIRPGMPASVRFLQTKRRHGGAARLARDLAAAPGVAPAAPGRLAETADGRAAADAVGVVPEADQVASGGIWSAALRARTAGLWVVWACINLAYYGAFIWIPTLLVDRGFTLPQSFTFTLII